MTRAKGRPLANAAATGAASPSTLTKAEKNKLARNRRKIEAEALKQARANAFYFVSEDTQDLITALIEDAFTAYQDTMDAAEEAAYAELAGTLEALTTEYGYSVILGADASNCFHIEETYTPPVNIIFEELNERGDKEDSEEVKEDAKALAATGRVNAFGYVEFPDETEPEPKPDEPEGGGGLTTAAAA
jgi:hypothetical protein